MEYTTLGSTGMEVSKICLGCMSFGSQDDWMLNPEEGRELVERAIDLGVNFFDTANAYSPIDPFGRVREPGLASVQRDRAGGISGCSGNV
jgi:aryl-alcohol dehydrogenase-like predicted oxidoreductase